MNVAITEYLEIDLDRERWNCRKCRHDLGGARDDYKHGLLVYDRDPREVHRPILDPERYRYTYSPDPSWCRILEYYCPGCGAQIETEYLPPGHPPTRDLELDVDDLKRRFANGGPRPVGPLGEAPGRLSRGEAGPRPVGKE